MLGYNRELWSMKGSIYERHIRTNCTLIFFTTIESAQTKLKYLGKNFSQEELTTNMKKPKPQKKEKQKTKVNKRKGKRFMKQIKGKHKNRQTLDPHKWKLVMLITISWHLISCDVTWDFHNSLLLLSFSP